jgi:hypothetical protein
MFKTRNPLRDRRYFSYIITFISYIIEITQITQISHQLHPTAVDLFTTITFLFNKINLSAYSKLKSTNLEIGNCYNTQTRNGFSLVTSFPIRLNVSYVTPNPMAFGNSFALINVKKTQKILTVTKKSHTIHIDDQSLWIRIVLLRQHTQKFICFVNVCSTYVASLLQNQYRLMHCFQDPTNLW